VNLSIAATETDWEAMPQYSYVERDEDTKDGAKASKIYSVWMLDGSPYWRLTEVNDQPLSPAQSDREREKLREEIARRANESPKERARRLAQYQKDRGRMFALLHEMGEAFDFRLVGEQNLENHDVYVLQALPRPGYQPKSRETKILAGMKGTLWIEKSTYQWVRVEAVAIKSVWLGWFIAKVLPGTRFLLEQTPVTKRLWLPEHFSFGARARILWWQKEYIHSERYQDYRQSSGLAAP
jgi:hypothetical protein